MEAWSFVLELYNIFRRRVGGRARVGVAQMPRRLGPGELLRSGVFWSFGMNVYLSSCYSLIFFRPVYEALHGEGDLSCKEAPLDFLCACLFQAALGNKWRVTFLSPPGPRLEQQIDASQLLVHSVISVMSFLAEVSRFAGQRSGSGRTS